VWPSDDDIYEIDDDGDFSDEGRKRQGTAHVGAKTPDADPERPRPRKARPRH
jgi:hypothetical protein